ncbi:unnamed protein product [Protopolystoma xenopodis]|uniref:Uncharacterized protein n=1 Tax=Protopolystoma xenopodis TaxID=117903 RepID=A0A448XPX9_9PLAT|nr:unnamed protein product [Protopolystoma xenopodis]
MGVSPNTHLIGHPNVPGGPSSPPAARMHSGLKACPSLQHHQQQQQQQLSGQSAGLRGSPGLVSGPDNQATQYISHHQHQQQAQLIGHPGGGMHMPMHFQQHKQNSQSGVVMSQANMVVSGQQMHGSLQSTGMAFILHFAQQSHLFPGGSNSQLLTISQNPCSATPPISAAPTGLPPPSVSPSITSTPPLSTGLVLSAQPGSSMGHNSTICPNPTPVSTGSLAPPGLLGLNMGLPHSLGRSMGPVVTSSNATPPPTLPASQQQQQARGASRIPQSGPSGQWQAMQTHSSPAKLSMQHRASGQMQQQQQQQQQQQPSGLQTNVSHNFYLNIILFLLSYALLSIIISWILLYPIRSKIYLVKKNGSENYRCPWPINQKK